MQRTRMTLACLGLSALAAWQSGMSLADDSGTGHRKVSKPRVEAASYRSKLDTRSEAGSQRQPFEGEESVDIVPSYGEEGSYEAGTCDSCDDSCCQECGDSCCSNSCCDSCCSNSCCNSCCGNRCRSCCEPCCRSCGFIGGAEFVYLRPDNHAGNGFSTQTLNANAGSLIAASDILDFPVDPDYETSGRYWVGYQGASGLGVRARYWEFDHAASTPVTLAAGTNFTGAFLGLDFPGEVRHSWDTNVFDAEVFKSKMLGKLDTTWSLGYRHVEYEESRGIFTDVTVLGIFTPITADIRKAFDGDGLTASAEVRRRLSCHFGLFANVRGSVLWGDETNSLAINVADIPALAVNVAQQEANVTKSIFEGQVGVELLRPLANGATLFARAGVEAQYWDEFGVSATLLNDDAAVDFFGFFGTLGISR